MPAQVSPFPRSTSLLSRWRTCLPSTSSSFSSSSRSLPSKLILVRPVRSIQIMSIQLGSRHVHLSECCPILIISSSRSSGRRPASTREAMDESCFTIGLVTIFRQLHPLALQTFFGYLGQYIRSATDDALDKYALVFRPAQSMIRCAQVNEPLSSAQTPSPVHPAQLTGPQLSSFLTRRRPHPCLGIPRPSTSLPR